MYEKLIKGLHDAENQLVKDARNFATGGDMVACDDRMKELTIQLIQNEAMTKRVLGGMGEVGEAETVLMHTAAVQNRVKESYQVGAKLPDVLAKGWARYLRAVETLTREVHSKVESMRLRGQPRKAVKQQMEVGGVWDVGDGNGMIDARQQMQNKPVMTLAEYAQVGEAMLEPGDVMIKHVFKEDNRTMMEWAIGKVEAHHKTDYPLGSPMAEHVAIAAELRSAHGSRCTVMVEAVGPGGQIRTANEMECYYKQNHYMVWRPVDDEFALYWSTLAAAVATRIANNDGFHVRAPDGAERLGRFWQVAVESTAAKSGNRMYYSKHQAVNAGGAVRVGAKDGTTQTKMLGFILGWTSISLMCSALPASLWAMLGMTNQGWDPGFAAPKKVQPIMLDHSMADRPALWRCVGRWGSHVPTESHYHVQQDACEGTNYGDYRRKEWNKNA